MLKKSQKYLDRKKVMKVTQGIFQRGLMKSSLSIQKNANIVEKS